MRPIITPSSLLPTALLSLMAIAAVSALTGAQAHAQSRCPSGLCGPDSGGGSRSNSREVTYSRRSLGAAGRSLQLLAGPAFRPAFSNRILPEPGFSYTQRPTLDAEATGLTLGAAYGITDAFELGALFLPMQLSPEFEFRDAYGWMTLQSRTDVTDVGLRVGFLAPLAEDNDAQLELALPAQLHLGDSGSIDLAVISLIEFGQDESIANFEIPVRVVMNPTENVFFGARSGIFLPKFESGALLLQLGAFVGYTVEAEDRPAADVTLSVNWPSFTSATDEYESVESDYFIVAVGSNGLLFFD